MALVRANVGICRIAGNKARRDRAERANRAGLGGEPVTFEIGSRVMAFREPVGVVARYHTRPRDFTTVWVGPWEVVERHGTVYKLRATRSGPGMRDGELIERTTMNLKQYKGYVVENEATGVAVCDKETTGGLDNDHNDGGDGCGCWSSIHLEAGTASSISVSRGNV